MPRAVGNSNGIQTLSEWLVHATCMVLHLMLLASLAVVVLAALAALAASSVEEEDMRTPLSTVGTDAKKNTYPSHDENSPSSVRAVPVIPDNLSYILK